MKRSNLTQLGEKYGTDKATYHKFTDFYEQELNGKDIRLILEIGILNGASLRMWKEYYPQAIVIGLDLQDPLEIPNVICLKGDATDIGFLNQQFAGIEFDLIIDDGSHKTADQITTFNYLWEAHLKPKGFYICEDIHTSFREDYVNSEVTAYDYLNGSHFFRDTKVFWKDENDKTDSGTMIMQKYPYREPFKFEPPPETSRIP